MLPLILILLFRASSPPSTSTPSRLPSPRRFPLSPSASTAATGGTSLALAGEVATHRQCFLSVILSVDVLGCAVGFTFVFSPSMRRYMYFVCPPRQKIQTMHGTPPWPIRPTRMKISVYEASHYTEVRDGGLSVNTKRETLTSIESQEGHFGAAMDKYE